MSKDPRYLNKTERAPDAVYQRLYERAYYVVCLRYPGRQDWQQDFPAYAMAAWLRGRRGTPQQLLMDYVRSVGLNLRASVRDSLSEDEQKNRILFLNPLELFDGGGAVAYKGLFTEESANLQLDMRRWLSSIHGDPQRVCFDVFRNGFDHGEIARLSGVSLSRISQLQADGVKQIREALINHTRAHHTRAYDQMELFVKKHKGTSYYAACKHAGGDICVVYKSKKARQSDVFLEILEKSNIRNQHKEVNNDVQQSIITEGDTNSN